MEGVKGTESWALRSCSLSFFMVRVLICSSSLLFSSCSWWRDFNMPTTGEKKTKKGQLHSLQGKVDPHRLCSVHKI